MRCDPQVKNRRHSRRGILSGTAQQSKRENLERLLP
jgi:hypothetical protein